jgi:hypothetical protein
MDESKKQKRGLAGLVRTPISLIQTYGIVSYLLNTTHVICTLEP